MGKRVRVERAPRRGNLLKAPLRWLGILKKHPSSADDGVFARRNLFPAGCNSTTVELLERQLERSASLDAALSEAETARDALSAAAADLKRKKAEAEAAQRSLEADMKALRVQLDATKRELSDRAATEREREAAWLDERNHRDELGKTITARAAAAEQRAAESERRASVAVAELEASRDAAMRERDAAKSEAEGTKEELRRARERRRSRPRARSHRVGAQVRTGAAG